MLCCPGLKQDRKLFRDRIRVLISEPEPEPEPEPDPHSHSGAGTGPESLVRSRNRIRVLISDPEPHSYSGAGTVHEKLTLSATIHSRDSETGSGYTVYALVLLNAFAVVPESSRQALGSDGQSPSSHLGMRPS